jgi:hypothetical protein
MIQIEDYPVFVNYSNPRDEERLEYEFASEGADDMVTWLRTNGRRLMEARPGGITPQSIKWERFVADQLDTVCSTGIGKCVFDGLNAEVPIYVVPFHTDDRAMCGCGGAGTLGIFEDKHGGGGIRIFFNPGDPEMRGYYGADDVLFHELIHAYRKGNNQGKRHEKSDQIDGYNSAEEFLAIHLQNVYLDCRGKRHYYFSHWEPTKRSKGDIYQEFVDRGEPLLALKYFVDNEPVASTVSKWPYPHPNFNPWRDYPQLVEIYKSKNEGWTLVSW